MTTLEVTEGKIMDRELLLKRIAMWRFLNKKIVFTNGCFDILHLGHIKYLSNARDLGDVLVVGVNTDDSVKRLKGEGRPLQDERTRTLALASLRFVEMVTLFDEDTPYELIKAIRPDILVKGGDYTEALVVGADIVKSDGGSVVILPLVPGYSTSSLIAKMK